MSIADALIADPAHLLHRIDPVAGIATFVPTSRAQLTRPSFIDGRSDFAAGPPVSVAIDDLLAAAAPEAPGPNRMIAHVAFCGSTLLARLIEREGVAMVLKEPNALVDLANWHRGGADERLMPMLQLALALLRRPWLAGEPVVVKPSNWINNLLGAVADDAAGWRPLFITMAPRAYVVAVLRGGRDRLAFAARTAAHLAPYVPEGEAWLQSAVAATGDPIGRAVNLALVALHVQQRLFGTPGEAQLDFAAIAERPRDAAAHAAAMLGLDYPAAAMDEQVRVHGAINAKVPGRPFSAADRELVDADIDAHHKATITAALAWADRTLG